MEIYCKGPNARKRSHDFTLQTMGNHGKDLRQMTQEVNCGSCVGRTCWTRKLKGSESDSCKRHSKREKMRDRKEIFHRQNRMLTNGFNEVQHV